MFWRLLLGNIAVTLVVFAVLVFSPVTLTLPMQPVEVEALAGVLVLLLLLNVAVLRAGLRPLRELRAAMDEIQTLRERDRHPSGVPTRWASSRPRSTRCSTALTRNGAGLLAWRCRLRRTSGSASRASCTTKSGRR